MTQLKIIDSHVHLWPKDMVQRQCYGWMESTPSLAKEHLLADYTAATTKSPHSRGCQLAVEAIVYIETDVRYDPSASTSDLRWAEIPLDEVRFLRDLVEAEKLDGNAPVLAGLVIWAPMDKPVKVLEAWLALAETAAGAQTWARVKGVRFLVQGIRDQARFEDMVLGPVFADNLRVLGERGLSFDVGVDQHSGGTWQLEVMERAIRAAHRDVQEESKTVFVLNHLCKPDFDADESGFDRWCESIEAMSRCSKTFMKVSGAFSELPADILVDDVAQRVQPWIDHVLRCFGPDRTMFGSDWPVCNVKRADIDRWVGWADVVFTALAAHKLSEAQLDSVWRSTAATAYGLAQQ